jgi:hypothetical protein
VAGCRRIVKKANTYIYQAKLTNIRSRKEKEEY